MMPSWQATCVGRRLSFLALPTGQLQRCLANGGTTRPNSVVDAFHQAKELPRCGRSSPLPAAGLGGQTFIKSSHFDPTARRRRRATGRSPRKPVRQLTAFQRAHLHSANRHDRLAAPIPRSDVGKPAKNRSTGRLAGRLSAVRHPIRTAAPARARAGRRRSRPGRRSRRGRARGSPPGWLKTRKGPNWVGAGWASFL